MCKRKKVLKTVELQSHWLVPLKGSCSLTQRLSLEVTVGKEVLGALTQQITSTVRSVTNVKLFELIQYSTCRDAAVSRDRSSLKTPLSYKILYPFFIWVLKFFKTWTGGSESHRKSCDWLEACRSRFQVLFRDRLPWMLIRFHLSWRLRRAVSEGQGGLRVTVRAPVNVRFTIINRIELFTFTCTLQSAITL